MSDSIPPLTSGEQRAIGALPRASHPRAGLEDQVVATLRAAGVFVTPAHARPTRHRGRILALTTAVLLVVGSGVLWRHQMLERPRDTYLLLLYEDASYRRPPPGQEQTRVQEYARWADSLRDRGHLDRAGELAGPGALTGFFIVRASTDSEAATIVQTCPHVKYGGHVELRRVME